MSYTETEPAPSAGLQAAGSTVAAVWILDDADTELTTTLRAWLNALELCQEPCEFVAVFNGSDSGCQDVIEELRKHDIESSVVHIHRKSDESAAIRAGLDATQAEVIVLLPSYRQVDEKAIPLMIKRLRSGFDYVASWRNPRTDSRWSSFKSQMFNSLTRRMTGVPLHDLNSGLRVFQRRIVDNLPFYGDMHRFLPILAAMQGFRVTEMPVQHLRERVRKGDYRPGVYVRRVLDLLSLFFLLKFVRKPLRFFGLIGNFFLAVGTVVVLYTVVERIFGVSLANRPALLLGMLLVVLGVQMFSLGLLGELIIFVHGRHVRDQYVEHIYRQSGPGDVD